MANKVVIKYTTFDFNKIKEQFPTKPGFKKKIFFQAELKSLDKGDANLGIIAYPAWRRTDKKNWTIGQPVAALDKPTEDQGFEFREPFALSNNELLLSETKKKSMDKERHKKHRRFLDLFEKLSGDQKLSAGATMRCKTGISANPHLEYEVTLESGGVVESFMTNPSPPARPEP